MFQNKKFQPNSNQTKQKKRVLTKKFRVMKRLIVLFIFLIGFLFQAKAETQHENLKTNHYWAFNEKVVPYQYPVKDKTDIQKGSKIVVTWIVKTHCHVIVEVTADVNDVKDMVNISAFVDWLVCDSGLF